MPFSSETLAASQNLFGTPEAGMSFCALSESDPARMHKALAAIARKIARTPRPEQVSDIPAGAIFLGQFVAHDLNSAGRSRGLLDLGFIYGEGPNRDNSLYQVSRGPGAGRHLLRLGPVRPVAGSPAAGPSRDLPRTNCPYVDLLVTEGRPDVLVASSLSDGNLLLAQMHVLWALLHNAAASRLEHADGPDLAFRLARRLTREVYRAVIRADLLGTWLMPRFRARYTAQRPQQLDWDAHPVPPREFLAGVGRLGHMLVSDIYSLNERRPVVGLRDILRHTSTSRPHEMPITHEWLADFSRFFVIGASMPQMAPAMGPHIARALATGVGQGGDASESGLVLLDLLASTTGSVRSVASLVAEASRREPDLFEGSVAQDETARYGLVARWLADTGLASEDIARLAADPPLVLFLMLEAEAETEGRSLGALGSVILGETIAAALAEDETDRELDAARAAVFSGPAPRSMAELVVFLQRHFQFPDGAHLHQGADIVPLQSVVYSAGGKTMLDIRQAVRTPIPRVEVADYIELGRLVAEWAIDPETRPRTLEELRRQLAGIAVLPPSIRSFSFAQGTADHVVFNLPDARTIEQSIEQMNDPMADARYPLPQFYADHHRPGFGPVMTLFDTLLARIGDQATSDGR